MTLTGSQLGRSSTLTEAGIVGRRVPCSDKRLRSAA